MQDYSQSHIEPVFVCLTQNGYFPQEFFILLSFPNCAALKIEQTNTCNGNRQEDASWQMFTIDRLT